MEVTVNKLKNSVSRHALEILKDLTRNKYKDILLLVTDINKGASNLPQTVQILSDAVDDAARDVMEYTYTERLENRYSEDGECVYESKPNYEGTAFYLKSELEQKDLPEFKFYVLNGKLYDVEPTTP